VLKNFVHQSLKQAIIKAFRYRTNTMFGHDAFIDIARLSAITGQNPGVILDVGANVGETAKRFAKEFRDRTVYAFEPHPETYKALERNIRGLSVVPIQVALNSTSGEKQLFTYQNSALNSLSEQTPFSERFGLSGKAILTRTTTIDTFCTEQQIDRIHILKIDTEGHDLNVLRGASKALSRGAVDFILFEFNDREDGEMGSLVNSLVATDRFLRQYCFRFVASYTDYVEAKGSFFVSANALYIRTGRSSNNGQ
jgi:FkbM family methyltransferase